MNDTSLLFDHIKETSLPLRLAIFFFIPFLFFVLSWIVSPDLCGVFTNESLSTDRGVNFTGFNAYVILWLSFSYLVTGLFGVVLAKRFLDPIPVHPLIRLFSSFFIGYLGIIGIARLFSFFISSNTLYSFLIFFVLLCCALAPREKKKIINLPHVQNITFGKTALILFFTVLFILLNLLMLLDQGDFGWVGHGPNQYACFIPILQKEWSFFPLVLRHYDELLFHYWASMPVMHKIAPIIPMWITLALIKLSVFCFIYSVFKKLNINALFSFLFTFFLFFGTFSPLPYKYFLVFDSANPLFFTVHSGRVVGIGMTLFLLAELFHSFSQEKSKMFLFVWVGLAATSFSNTSWAIFLVALFFLIRNASRFMKEPKNFFWQEKAFLLVPVAIVVSLLMYPFLLTNLGNDFLHAYRIGNELIYLRLGMCSIYCYFLAKTGLNHLRSQRVESQNNSSYNYLKWVMLVSLFSVVVLGNIPAAVLFKTLGTRLTEHLPSSLHVLKFYEKNLNEMPLEAGLGAPQPQLTRCLIGDFRENGTYNEYCRSAYHMIAYHGLFFIFILIANEFITNRIKRREIFPGPQKEFFSVFLFLLAFFPLLLFFIDYIRVGSINAWIKSRFLEIPIYLGFFMSFYFIYDSTKQMGKKLLGIMLLCYTLLPFICTERYLRLFNNAKVLIKLLF